MKIKLFIILISSASVFLAWGTADAWTEIPGYITQGSGYARYNYLTPSAIYTGTTTFYSGIWPATDTPVDYNNMQSTSSDMYCWNPTTCDQGTGTGHYVWRWFYGDYYYTAYWSSTTQTWSGGIECSDENMQNPWNCINLNPTCAFNYANNTCETASTTCASGIISCGKCLTETACEAQTDCDWHKDWWNSFVQVIQDTATSMTAYCSYTSTSTVASTTALTEGFGNMRTSLGNKIPFVYFFAMWDAVQYLANDNSTTDLASISLTIPVLNASGTSATTGVATGSMIFSSAISIPVVSQSEIFRFLPKTVWDTVKALFSAGLFVLLFFGLRKKITEITQIHT